MTAGDRPPSPTRGTRRALGARPGQTRRLLVAELERERLAARPGDPPSGGDVAERGDSDAADVAMPLHAVTAALEARGVPYVVVPPDAGRPWRVVVAEPHGRRARRALRRVGPTDPGPPCAVELRPLDPELPERLWEVRWRASERVGYRGPAEVDEVHVDERAYPAPRTLGTAPKVDEVTFPVDVVYTWVDGTDPAWQAGKAAVLRELGADACPPDADDPSRYHSHDELRYSLRSVATFAPFVRHVFLVTAGQVPAWLDTDHERLTVVDHRDIFPEDAALPTFNSHAIESRLHHIPGLAEHYLYLNDDFFFGRPVTPEHFFHAGGATRYFPSPARIPAATTRAATTPAVDAAARNTRAVIHERFGRLVEHKCKHAPYPQRRSVLFEMEQVLRDEFRRTAASRLRSVHDVAVPSSLSHYYGALTGRAVPGRIGSQYVSLGEPDLQRRLRGLRRGRGFDVLCINDSADAHTQDLARRSRLLRRFMADYWPTRSPFER